MMRRFLGLLAVAALAACSLDTVDPTNDLIQWVGSAEGSEPGWEHLIVQAELAFAEGDPQIGAAVSLAEDELQAIRPWHAHFGTCGEPGAIIGTDTAYPRLVVTEDGSASSITGVPATIDPAGSYHVDIHLSETEMDVIIACVDLARLEQ